MTNNARSNNPFTFAAPQQQPAPAEPKPNSLTSLVNASTASVARTFELLQRLRAVEEAADNDVKEAVKKHVEAGLAHADLVAAILAERSRLPLTA